MGGARVAVLIVALLQAPGIARAQPEPVSDAENVKAALLRDGTAEYVRRENLGEIFGGISSIFAVAGIAVSAAVWDDDRPMAVTWAAGFGAGTAAVAGSLFASRDVRGDVLTSMNFWNAGVFAVGVAVADDPLVPRISSAGMAIGAFGTGILHGVNMLSRRTPVSTLRLNLRRLDARAQRPLSDTELERMERDLLGVEAPLAPWVVALPYLLGGAVSLAPAFDPDISDDERSWAGLLGGAGLLNGIFGLLTKDVATAYRERTASSGVSFNFGPGSLHGRYEF